MRRENHLRASFKQGFVFIFSALDCRCAVVNAYLEFPIKTGCNMTSWVKWTLSFLILSLCWNILSQQQKWNESNQRVENWSLQLHAELTFPEVGFHSKVAQPVSVKRWTNHEWSVVLTYSWISATQRRRFLTYAVPGWALRMSGQVRIALPTVSDYCDSTSTGGVSGYHSQREARCRLPEAGNGERMWDFTG